MIPKPVFTAIYEPGDECEKPAEDSGILGGAGGSLKA